MSDFKKGDRVQIISGPENYEFKQEFLRVGNTGTVIALRAGGTVIVNLDTKIELDNPDDARYWAYHSNQLAKEEA